MALGIFIKGNMSAERLLHAGVCAEHFIGVASFHCCPHCTQGEPGTWGDEVARPGTYCWCEPEPVCNFGRSDPRAGALTHQAVYCVILKNILTMN